MANGRVLRPYNQSIARRRFQIASTRNIFHTFFFLQRTELVKDLQRIARALNEPELTLVSIDPDPRAYRDAYGRFQTLKIGPDDSPDLYVQHINQGSINNPADSITNCSNKVVVFGTSFRWIAYGEYSVDLVAISVLDSKIDHELKQNIVESELLSVDDVIEEYSRAKSVIRPDRDALIKFYAPVR